MTSHLKKKKARVKGNRLMFSSYSEKFVYGHSSHLSVNIRRAHIFFGDDQLNVLTSTIISFQNTALSVVLNVRLI